MKRFLAFFLFLTFGITAYAGETEKTIDLYAQSAVLMDAESGRILFEKNGHEVLPMASTTKIMTCILALEKGNMDDVVTATVNAAAQPRVHLGMREGEQFYLKDLLYSLMLESHNDSAVAIAEHLSESVEEFAKCMNKKAKQLGCTSTYFVTPNGLDGVDDHGAHATTAAELARMMSYCIMESPKKEEFLEITRTSSYSFLNVEGSRNFSCQNRNTFLTMMEEAITGKTGFTGKAGYCYVGAVERDGRTFVVALLACGWPNNKNYKWADMKELAEYALENYEYQNIYEELRMSPVLVEEGVSKSGKLFESRYVNLKVDIGEPKELNVLLHKNEKVEMKVEYAEKLEAPLHEGMQAGKVKYYLDGEEIYSCPIVVEEEVERRDLTWYFERVVKLYFCAT